MSYILEALRRAEQERSRGQPAPVQIVSEHGQPVLRSAERPVWPWLALGFALALGVGGLMLWWLKPAAPTLAAPAETPVPASAESGAAINSAGNLSSLDDLVDDSAAVELPPLPEDAGLQVFDAAQPEPEPSPEPEGMDLPEAEPAEAQTQHQSIQLDPPPQSALDARQKTLKDMPAEYRNDFPKLNVEVHAYDEDPAARFALINGRRYHEGEQLPEGPVLSEISADGIIFSFRNAEVLVPVGY